MRWLHLTIHQKAISVLLLATIAVAFMVLAVSWYLVIPGLLVHEQQLMEERIVTLDGLFRRFIDEVDDTLADYATWDRSYDFMMGRNPKFGTVDISDSSFQRYDIQLLLLMRFDGSVALARTFHAPGEKGSSDADIDLIVATARQHLAALHEGGRVRGIVRGASSPYRVAMRPIVNTQGNAPSPGVFLMARRIDTAELQELTQLARATIGLLPPNDGVMRQPGEMTAVSGGRAMMRRSSSQNTVYFPFVDVNGMPAGVITITSDRDVYQQTKRLVLLGTAFTATAVILVGSFKLWFIHALILRRMEKALRAFDEITRTNDLSIRIPISEKDELGKMATVVNNMLDELERSRTKLEALMADAQFDATHDALTGLKNRRSILNALEVELSRTARQRQRVAVMLADIDHFKQINDQYGHSAGDAVLQEVAKALDAELRPYDVAGRYGGEEFLIIIPTMNNVRAMEVAERLRLRICETVRANGSSHPVTISVGVTVTAGNEPMETVIDAADAAMYAAKQGGRNRVQLAVGQRHCEVVPIKEYSGA
jgi:diguanylate cyclase (GGDEF)-like protein